MPSERRWSRRPARWIGACVFALLLSGCPRVPLPPPPKGAGGPATQMLAERDARIGAVRANAVLRTRIPEGRQGAPGGKLTSIALAAARPPRARLEILTPFGTPAATILLADGLFQAYDPFGHVLRRAPMDSPRVAELLGQVPLPLASVPDLMRGAVPIESGEITEARIPGVPGATPDEKGEPEKILLEVRRDGRVVQQVEVHAEGGYPLEDRRFDPLTGQVTLQTRYSAYGGVETKTGPVAFPQKITTQIFDDSGARAAEVEVRLSGIDLEPNLPEDAFRLDFERPPEVLEL